jgi:hypothetical protein
VQVNFKFKVSARVKFYDYGRFVEGIIFEACYDGKHKYYKMIKVYPYYIDKDAEIYIKDEGDLLIMEK